MYSSIKQHFSRILFIFPLVVFMSNLLSNSLLSKAALVVAYIAWAVECGVKQPKLPVSIEMRRTFLFWISCFLLFCLCSGIWCISTEMWRMQIVGQMIMFLFFLPFILSIRSKEDTESFMYIYIIAGLVLVVYLLSKNNILEMTKTVGTRLSVESEITDGYSQWQTNNVAIYFVTVLNLVVYLIIKHLRAEKTVKWSLVVIAIILSIIILLTGSKKGIVGIFIILSLYPIFATKKRKINWKMVLIVGISGIGAVIAIFNIEFLYATIGNRIEDFILGQQTGVSDASTVMRAYMIEFGLEKFAERPILGYGINCYSVLFGQESGWTVYSHNNFIELLVGTGILGAIIYHALLIGLFVGSRSVYDRLDRWFINISLVVITFFEFSAVAYKDYSCTMLLLLSTAVMCYSKKEHIGEVYEN